jgi:hypothetical protein
MSDSFWFELEFLFSMTRFYVLIPFDGWFKFYYTHENIGYLGGTVESFISQIECMDFLGFSSSIPVNVETVQMLAALNFSNFVTAFSHYLKDY